MNPIERALSKNMMLSHLQYFQSIILAAIWKTDREKRKVMVRITTIAKIPVKNDSVQDQGERKEVMKSS